MKAQILILVLCFTLSYCKKSSLPETTPPESSSAESSPADSSPPAILAIEIVNPNDTTTERNTSKRTIESSLGYGYQANYFPTSQGKKFMIYPYSQKDIPPAPVREYEGSTSLSVQKSIQYNLGTKVEPSNNYPSTLYSTIGQGGTIGGLSSNVPQQTQPTTAIPVIILRIYTNQLSDQGAIYPNLPQSHPYSNLNNINLQTIISNYLQQHMYQAQQQYKQPTQPVYPNMVYYPTYYPQQQEPNLPTHENYPSNSHTRVIYHGPKGHIMQPYQQQYQQQQQQQYVEQPQYVQQQQQQYQQHQPSENQYQNVYTDANGQSYIYVDANQVQGQYYQQDYQQEYPQEQQEVQQEYTYQKPQEDRRYLPTPSPVKYYNYHAESMKDRSKKSTGAPTGYEPKKTAPKRKA